jgi:hypothetical protein
MINPFDPFMNIGYSIEINFIHKTDEGVEVYQLSIKKYDKSIFYAYWIAYPSDELVLSIIREHHRNEMIVELGI